MKFNQLRFLSLLLLLFSCNDSNKQSKEAVPSVSTDGVSNSEVLETTNLSSQLDGIWVLTKLNKTTITNKTSTKNPTLHINLSEGTIMGNGGCNRYDGTINFMEEKQLKIDPVRATEIACERSDLETKYFAALSNEILTYILNDKELTLFRDGTTMVFEKAE